MPFESKNWRANTRWTSKSHATERRERMAKVATFMKSSVAFDTIVSFKISSTTSVNVSLSKWSWSDLSSCLK